MASGLRYPNCSKLGSMRRTVCTAAHRALAHALPVIDDHSREPLCDPKWCVGRDRRCRNERIVGVIPSAAGRYTLPNGAERVFG